jgi:hypothetical protein
MVGPAAAWPVASGDICATSASQLPSDVGWRRYRLVNGHRCWFVDTTTTRRRARAGHHRRHAAAPARSRPAPMRQVTHQQPATPPSLAAADLPLTEIQVTPVTLPSGTWATCSWAAGWTCQQCPGCVEIPQKLEAARVELAPAAPPRRVSDSFSQISPREELKTEPIAVYPQPQPPAVIERNIGHGWFMLMLAVAGGIGIAIAAWPLWRSRT